MSELESVIRQLRLPHGVGLAGQVWEHGEPRNVLSLADDPRFPMEAVAGLRGAVALPAIHAGEVLAVLEFCCEPVSVDVTDGSCGRSPASATSWASSWHTAGASSGRST